MKLVPHPQTPATYKGLSSPSWITIDINDSLVSSYREDYLDSFTFPSSLHFHDYYEVVVLLKGEIRYACESSTVKPECCDVIVIPPGKFHMSLIAADETQYNRQVFYFYPDAFSSYQCNNLLDFIKPITSENFSFSLSSDDQERLLHLIAKLKKHAQQDAVGNHALILADIFQIFHLFNQPIETHLPADEYFPASLIEIQNYIDEHFIDINSTADVAMQTFYTREHISRLFKKYKKITVTEYIIQRRINYSCHLMKTDMTLADICFQAGFGSVPAFIRAFKRVMGTTPSQYRNNLNINAKTTK